jgi:ring-1,2-phenylacetyl-CoA epoxidase subunit PaaD
MVTVADLGILRDVAAEDGRLVVTITPTYSGCPALPEIAHDLRHRLSRAGLAEVIVRTALAPAWSSDMVTADLRTARKIAAAVPDPELPMVTVADLGILRDVAATCLRTKNARCWPRWRPRRTGCALTRCC